VRIDLPSQKTVFKWTLSVLGIIFLGAISNGVWESLLRPATHSISRSVLDIASFGVRNYKNGIYQQIAADNQSDVAFETLFRVTAVYGFILAIYLVELLGRLDSLKSRGQKVLRRLSDLPLNRDPAAPSHVPSLAEFEASTEALRQQSTRLLKSTERARLTTYVLAVAVGLTFVGYFVSLARLSYANSADAHYHHVLRVASPYLSSGEQAEVESDFAQIGSREDYVKVLSRLDDLLKAHGRTVPKFDPW
jgi:hypothetical protein